jgi:hypothetical protein
MGNIAYLGLTALGRGQTMVGLRGAKHRVRTLKARRSGEPFLHRAHHPEAILIAPLRFLVRRYCAQIQNRPDCIS